MTIFDELKARGLLAQLTDEEEKHLIDELYQDPEELLSDCYIDELPPFILNIIEENGLKNGDIAYSISQKWKEFESIDGKTKEDWGEKENYWFLKAVELGSNSISLKDYMFEDSDGEPDFDYLEMDYDTPLIEKAKADCYNSWGCRYALGLDDEEVENLCDCDDWYDAGFDEGRVIGSLDTYIKAIGIVKAGVRDEKIYD